MTEMDLPHNRLCIPSALDQDVEHDAMFVDGTPEPMLPACDVDHELVEMSFVA
jgi:hypothetical protein